MKSLLCPVSYERVSEGTVRLTGFMVASALLVSLLAGLPILAWFVAVDYCIRAFTDLPYSPLSWLAGKLSTLIQFTGRQIDKAPKIFAARVGFTFALIGSILLVIQPISGVVVLSVLILFALLESIGNICMGCIVYTHVVLRIYGSGNDN